MNSVDYPAIEVNEGQGRIIWASRNGELIYSDPRRGLLRQKIDSLNKEKSLKLLLVKRKIDASENKFGWSWFIPS